MALPVQVAMRQAVGEPFPAHLLPSFGVPDDDGRAIVVHRGYAAGQPSPRPDPLGLKVPLTPTAGGA